MLTTVLAVLGIWTLWSLATLYQNYRLAKKIGLPIVLDPVSNLSLVWLLSDGLTKQIETLRPIRDKVVRRFMPFSYFGWQYDQGYAVHKKYGPAFVFVSPGSIQLSVGDPAAAYDILNRRKNFIKPPLIYDHLNIFGPSVNSAEGEVWQRHRRFTAPSFNERISSSVWEESRRLAQQLLDKWLQAGKEGVSTMVEDTADLALTVLTVVGFGQPADTVKPTAEPGQSMTLNSAVHSILTKFVLFNIIPMHYMVAPYMPRALQRLGEAYSYFKAYVDKSLAQERSRIDRGDQTATNNLLSSLVRAADAEKNEKSSIGLSDKEIYGNMFIYTLAGHETTANTLATAIMYLIRYPNYQDWLREELQYVLKDKSLTSPSYEICFPPLKRCLAIMYETLRIHGSIVTMPKSTHSNPETLNVKGKDYVIPPNTLIMVNNHATQTDPEYWGKDSEEWKPDRWITNSSTAQSMDYEEMLQPKNGTFMAWAEGPRSCLGKKFSQVEFVAALMTWFAQHKVEPVQVSRGRQYMSVNDDIDIMLKDSEVGMATLQMRQPKRVHIAWKAVP